MKPFLFSLMMITLAFPCLALPHIWLYVYDISATYADVNSAVRFFNQVDTIGPRYQKLLGIETLFDTHGEHANHSLDSYLIHKIKGHFIVDKMFLWVEGRTPNEEVPELAFVIPHTPSFESVVTCSINLHTKMHGTLHDCFSATSEIYLLTCYAAQNSDSPPPPKKVDLLRAMATWLLPPGGKIFSPAGPLQIRESLCRTIYTFFIQPRSLTVLGRNRFRFAKEPPQEVFPWLIFRDKGIWRYYNGAILTWP